MANPIVSIIMPVYNEEKYIEQCLDSLLAQTFQNFELVCVDDGSTDFSLQILKNYESEHNQIRVLSQKNKYAGTARNAGMRVANGKYLLFLDADDFSREDMLERIVDYAETNQTEILIFDEFQFDNISQKVIQTTWRPLKKEMFGEGIKSAHEIADIIFDFADPGPCNKLFLREFIVKNDLWFQEIQRTNDLYFVYAAFSYAERIGVLDEKFLYIRDNNPKSLQGSGSETPAVFSEAIFALKDHMEKRGVFDVFRKSFNNMAISIAVYNLNNMKTEKAYRQLYFAMRDEIFPKLYLGNKLVDSKIERAIQLQEEVIIYGAGTLAMAITKLLICQYGYAKEKLTVAVSSIGNNLSRLCEIEVREFQTVSKSKVNELVIIAVSDQKIQKEIENGIRQKGFYNVVKVGFDEFASLIRYEGHKVK